MTGGRPRGSIIMALACCPGAALDMELETGRPAGVVWCVYAGGLRGLLGGWSKGGE